MGSAQLSSAQLAQSPAAEAAMALLLRSSPSPLYSATAAVYVFLTYFLADTPRISSQNSLLCHSNICIRTENAWVKSKKIRT
jgi:hypothetical protein